MYKRYDEILIPSSLYSVHSIIKTLTKRDAWMDHKLDNLYHGVALELDDDVFDEAALGELVQQAVQALLVHLDSIPFFRFRLRNEYYRFTTFRLLCLQH